MPDPQTLFATAAIIGAVTKLLTEVRHWRRKRDGDPPDSPR